MREEYDPYIMMHDKIFIRDSLSFTVNSMYKALLLPAVPSFPSYA